MKNIKPKDIERQWHLIDAKSKILGRLSSQVAAILMGKNKNIFTPYLDTGDNIVVINAKGIVLTGKKEKQKKYYRHSGYPGGLYSQIASQVRDAKPEELIRHSVKGMLPKTKLGKLMLKKLHVYEANDHPFKNQIMNNK